MQRLQEGCRGAVCWQRVTGAGIPRVSPSLQAACAAARRLTLFLCSDKMFFKSARIYLRDRYTNRKIDPMFDVQHLTNTYSHLLAQPARKSEFPDREEVGAVPSVEEHSGRDSRPPSQQGLSENVLLLRRLTSQGQDIGRVSAAVKKLEKEMREVKKMLAISSGNTAKDFNRGVDLMSSSLRQLNPENGEIARLRMENEALRRKLETFEHRAKDPSRGARTNGDHRRVNGSTNQMVEHEAGYDFDAALSQDDYQDDYQVEYQEDYLDRDDSLSSAYMPDGARFGRMSGSYDPADDRNLETRMRQARVDIFGGEEFIDTRIGTTVAPNPDPWTLREEEMVRILRDCGKTFAVISTYLPKRSAGAVRKHWYADMEQARPADSPFTPEDIEEMRASLGLDREAPRSKLRRGPGRPRKLGLGNVIHVGEDMTATLNPEALTQAQLEEEQQFEQHFQARPNGNGIVELSAPPVTRDEPSNAEMPIDPALLDIGSTRIQPDPALAASDIIKDEYQDEFGAAAQNSIPQSQLSAADAPERPQSQSHPPVLDGPVESEYPPLISPEKPQQVRAPIQNLDKVAVLTSSDRPRASSVLRGDSPAAASRAKARGSGTRKVTPRTYQRKSARVTSGDATANGHGIRNENPESFLEVTDAEREKKRREKIAARDLLVRKAMEREEMAAA